MKHARIRFEGEVHAVTVEAENAVRLADGRLIGESLVEWLPPATASTSGSLQHRFIASTSSQARR